MAKNRSYIDLEGTLGGLTYYRSGGQSIVKTKSSINRDRILREANFRRTRENMSEFGGSAVVGKALRQGFASVLSTMSDRTVTGRLTAAMKRINANGSGVRGKRSFVILPNKALLEGFEFNQGIGFETVFYAPFADPSLDANRSVTTWTIPDFNTSNYIRPPEGATHFRLVLVSSVLSDYAYDNSLKSYEPVVPDANTVSALALSAELPLGGLVGSDTTLSTDLGFSSALPATVAVVIGIGILFYQEINGTFYELASDNALRIGLIG